MSDKPTMEQLRAKYGPNWGLAPMAEQRKRPSAFCTDWDELCRKQGVDPKQAAEEYAAAERLMKQARRIAGGEL